MSTLLNALDAGARIDRADGYDGETRLARCGYVGGDDAISRQVLRLDDPGKMECRDD